MKNKQIEEQNKIDSDWNSSHQLDILVENIFSWLSI